MNPSRQQPPLSENCRALFEAALQDAGVYLEFGAGDSTLLAARMGVPVIVAVDSRLDRVRDVGRQFAAAPPYTQVVVLHADLGPVDESGYPSDESRIAQWPTYYAGAWDAVLARAPGADLVRIHGRFRVPSFLYSLLHVQPGATILWDDYRDVPEYNRVERFLKPTTHVDRMAVFRTTERVDAAKVLPELFQCLYLAD